MPGIFGGVGQPPEVYAALKNAFSSTWGDVQVYEIPGAFLGGHAFGRKRVVHVNQDGSAIAVDGEGSVYEYAEEYSTTGDTLLFECQNGRLRLTPLCKGNLVTVDTRARIWRIGIDVSGTFPFYYAIHNSGFLFSSSLRILRRITSVNPDPIGVLEFLREGYTINTRCLVKNVLRALPGQVLTYHADTGRLFVTEESRLWTNPSANGVRGSALADAAWTGLHTAIARSIRRNDNNILMLSGGWDSRTLLAALLAYCEDGRFQTFTHGDAASREIQLAHQLSMAVGIPHRHASIDDSIYDLAQLQRGFERVENVVFPHWHRSSQILLSAGSNRLVAGVYGEILGGHYGPAMLQHGSAKILSVLRQLVRRSQYEIASQGHTNRVDDFLRLSVLKRPWYLHAEWWGDLKVDALEQINSDIEESLKRLRARGITTPLQLVEAFISEHRGSQYINGQILSGRWCLDIAMPYTDRDLLEFATQIPLADKIHNRINQNMLRNHASTLLRFPCAATLVSASAPIAIQETSRLVRKCWEELSWRCHFSSRGLLSYPRLSWVNFEFARKSEAFQRIIEDLKVAWWDKPALHRQIAQVKEGQWRKPVHPISDQLMKIYTIDLMFR